MNNRQDWAHNSPYPRSLYQQSSEDSSAVTRITTTIALLVLGYYALTFFGLCLSNFQRRAYEIFIDIIPPRLLLLMQSFMTRVGILSRDGVRFKLEDFTSRQAKSNVLRELLGFENNRITSVVRKARTFSGLDNILPPSTEIGPAGLGNWDNSCYQNSVLHGFASLPAFNAFMSKSWDLMRQRGTAAPTHEALVSFLEKLNASNQTKRTLWTPAVLKSMDSWQQQDAQEYFSRILDEVEKEDVKFYNSRRARDGLENLVSVGQTKEGENATIIRNPRDNANTITPEPESPEQQVETLAAESVKTASLPERNPLDGMLAQSLKCRTCGYTEGLSLTQFNCITVNLGTMGGKSTLEQLLDEYTDPEDIDGVECTQCTKLVNPEPKLVENEAAPLNTSEPVTDAQTKLEVLVPNSDQPEDLENVKPTSKRPKPIFSTKSKQLTIARLPEDLVIHLNRSIFDMYGNQRKNTALVDFPLRLSILNRWCAPLDDVDGRSTQAEYTLRCVVTHAGRHDDGHYVAYAKRGKDWYCFNDELVTKVSEEFVFNRGNAFMLFYEDGSHRLSSKDTVEHSESRAEPQRDTSVVALIENGGAEEIAAGNEATEVEPQIAELISGVKVPSYDCISPEVLPQVPATSRDKSDADTRSSSASTSDTDVEDESEHDIRLETILPPMRTASESSAMHQRMESSHTAPVF